MMKVVCIDNSYHVPALTLNGVYPILEEKQDRYLLIDDNNNYSYFFKNRFKPYNPIDKLKSLLEDK